MSKGRYRRRKFFKQRAVWEIAALLAVLVGLLGYLAFRPRPGQAMPDEGNLHITYPQTAEYGTTPPTSGPHYTNLAPWGVHDEPIPNELQVHNLEDGGVMIQYNCTESCPDLVDQLASIVKRYDEGVILAPYPDMPYRIALTAWTRLDTLETFDEARIVTFIEAYRGLDHHR